MHAFMEGDVIVIDMENAEIVCTPETTVAFRVAANVPEIHWRNCNVTKAGGGWFDVGIEQYEGGPDAR